MGGGLAGEQKVKPVQQHLPTEGLVGVEIVAQQSIIARGVTLGVGDQPAHGLQQPLLVESLVECVELAEELRPLKQPLRDHKQPADTSGSFVACF